MKILANSLKAAIILAVIAFGLTMVVPAGHTLADAKTDACAGVNSVSGGSNCQPAKGAPTVNGLLTTIINVLSLVVGIVAVIMVIFGGFKYITSNGDANSINSARSTITYAIVGLVFAATAQLLVHFVLNRIST